MDSLADDSIQPDVTDDEKHQKAAANIKEVKSYLTFLEACYDLISSSSLPMKIQIKGREND